MTCSINIWSTLAFWDCVLISFAFKPSFLAEGLISLECLKKWNNISQIGQICQGWGELSLNGLRSVLSYYSQFKKLRSIFIFKYFQMESAYNRLGDVLLVVSALVHLQHIARERTLG